MQAIAAASDRASPPKVVKKNTSFSSSDITSRRPVTAESGMPLAIALENSARSALTPGTPGRRRGRAEAGPHLVEDQQRAVPIAEPPQLREEAVLLALEREGSRITQAVSSSSAATTEARSL